MSKIKEIKNNLDNYIDISDFLLLFCPGKKIKYLTALTKYLVNNPGWEGEFESAVEHLSRDFNISPEVLKQYNHVHLVLLRNLISYSIGWDKIQSFTKFCEFNERGLIKENDITQYKKIDDMIYAVSLAEMKNIEKELEKQIKLIFEDEEWIILRPLTSNASNKYGASTRWCTTSSDGYVFSDYIVNGTLIYSINKKTGVKVAVYCDSARNISFWDQKDDRIDSLSSGLPYEIIMMIKNEIDTYPQGNLYFLPEEYKKLLNNFQPKEDVPSFPWANGAVPPMSEEYPEEEKEIRKAIQETIDIILTETNSVSLEKLKGFVDGLAPNIKSF